MLAQEYGKYDSCPITYMLFPAHLTACENIPRSPIPTKSGRPNGLPRSSLRRLKPSRVPFRNGLNPSRVLFCNELNPVRGSISVDGGHIRVSPTTPEGLHTVTHDESPAGDFTTTLGTSSELQICIL